MPACSSGSGSPRAAKIADGHRPAAFAVNRLGIVSWFSYDRLEDGECVTPHSLLPFPPSLSPLPTLGDVSLGRFAWFPGKPGSGGVVGDDLMDISLSRLSLDGFLSVS